MKRIHILAVAALIGLVAVLALPAAALAPATGTDNAGIDPGLKDELWTIHTQHRLDIFDGNVMAAGEAIGVIEKYGYDVTGLSATVDVIRGHRGALAAALEDRDREELRSINREIFSLWKDLRQETKELLKGE
ncbi:MAG: hypothetical protein HGA55_02610 [Methanoregulaceae archaeon]|nr:hypothetical protein [Methanoregulaceae archaeon]